MEHHLLIDLGTGSTRVALVSSEGELVAMRSFFNRYYRDEAYPDAQYFLPEEWQAEILRCCRELHAERPEIRVRAVSSAGARQTIVLLDREGRAFYGLPNIDNRGREFMEEIRDQAQIYERSGKSERRVHITALVRHHARHALKIWQGLVHILNRLHLTVPHRAHLLRITSEIVHRRHLHLLLRYRRRLHLL